MYRLSCGQVPMKLALFSVPDVESTKATLVVLIRIVGHSGVIIKYIFNIGFVNG